MKRKQRWCCLLGMITLLVIFGCATVTYPPPELQENKYINFEFQYSVEIPPGWVLPDNIPEDVAFLESEEFAKYPKFLLVNKKTDGRIIIFNLKFRKQYEHFVTKPADEYKKAVLKRRDAMKRDLNILRFSYDLHKENLSKTAIKKESEGNSYKPKELLNVDFDIDFTTTVGKAVVKYYLYPCQSNKTCAALLMLLGKRDQYENNKPSFDAFVSSLMMHDDKEAQ